MAGWPHCRLPTETRLWHAPPVSPPVNPPEGTCSDVGKHSSLCKALPRGLRQSCSQRCHGAGAEMLGCLRPHNQQSQQHCKEHSSFCMRRALSHDLRQSCSPCCHGIHREALGCLQTNHRKLVAVTSRILAVTDMCSHSTPHQTQETLRRRGKWQVTSALCAKSVTEVTGKTRASRGL